MPHIGDGFRGPKLEWNKLTRLPSLSITESYVKFDIFHLQDNLNLSVGAPYVYPKIIFK